MVMLIQIKETPRYFAYCREDGGIGESAMFCHGGFNPTARNSVYPKWLAAVGFKAIAPKYADAISLDDDLTLIQSIVQEFSSFTLIMGMSRGGYLAAHAYCQGGFGMGIFCSAPMYVDRWPFWNTLGRRKPYFMKNVPKLERPEKALLVTGDEDEIVPVTQAFRFRRENPGVKVCVIPGGHGALKKKENWAPIVRFININLKDRIF